MAVIQRTNYNATDLAATLAVGQSVPEGAIVTLDNGDRYTLTSVWNSGTLGDADKVTGSDTGWLPIDGTGGSSLGGGVDSADLYVRQKNGLVNIIGQIEFDNIQSGAAEILRLPTAIDPPETANVAFVNSNSFGGTTPDGYIRAALYADGAQGVVDGVISESPQNLGLISICVTYFTGS
jgi:hypothetical protein